MWERKGDVRRRKFLRVKENPVIFFKSEWNTHGTTVKCCAVSLSFREIVSSWARRIAII